MYQADIYRVTNSLPRTYFNSPVVNSSYSEIQMISICQRISVILSGEQDISIKVAVKTNPSMDHTLTSCDHPTRAAMQDKEMWLARRRNLPRITLGTFLGRNALHIEITHNGNDKQDRNQSDGAKYGAGATRLDKILISESESDMDSPMRKDNLWARARKES